MTQNTNEAEKLQSLYRKSSFISPSVFTLWLYKTVLKSLANNFVFLGVCVKLVKHWKTLKNSPLLPLIKPTGSVKPLVPFASDSLKLFLNFGQNSFLNELKNFDVKYSGLNSLLSLNFHNWKLYNWKWCIECQARFVSFFFKLLYKPPCMWARQPKTPNPKLNRQTNNAKKFKNLKHEIQQPITQ